MSGTPTWSFYTEPSKIDVRGLDVAYRRKGEGEAVVYFHGAGLTQRWLPFYEEASKHVDFIVPEHPGFGDTAFPEWVDGFEDVVLHYADFLNELGLDKVHLVGHSFGGWIAAEFASYYPERLKSLQLIAPAGLKGCDLHDSYRQSGDEAIERLFNGEEARYPEYLEEGDDPAEALVQNYMETTARARLAWYPRHNRKLPRRLERVNVPTQVILPEDDRLLSSEAGAKYADYIPGATTTVITAQPVPTTHLPFIQAPEGLAEMISNFVADHSKGSNS